MMAQAEIPLFVSVLHHYDLTLPSNSQLLCKTSIVTNKKTCWVVLCRASAQDAFINTIQIIHYGTDRNDRPFGLRSESKI